MATILFISAIIFYILHRYFLKQQVIKDAVESQKQIEIRKAAVELQRQKEANEIQKRNEARELQRQKEAVEFSENILERIKKEGGLNYSYNSPHYNYYNKLHDYNDKIINNNLESNLINAGRQDLIEQIKYGFKYLYLCPKCKTVTDVKKTELNHGHDETQYLSNGRYTKDGSLDERYDTKFRIRHKYYFDAVCDHCVTTFKVELDEDGFKSRNEL
jgi:hypothetical protein